MVSFYDTRLNENGGIMLVEEKQADYETQEMTSPEHIYMLALDSACGLLGIFFLSKGTVNVALASPREIYIRALSAGAAQIILIHNHPSGNALPSGQDIRLTKKVKEAGELLDIRLADHIIIGGKSGAYISFHEAKLI